MTTGIADIGSLVDCFYGICDGKAGIDILDKYDEVRRSIFQTVTNAISTANLNRVRKDADTLQDGSDQLFVLLNAAKKDPALYKQLKQVSPVPVTFFERLQAHMVALPRWK